MVTFKLVDYEPNLVFDLCDFNSTTSIILGLRSDCLINNVRCAILISDVIFGSDMETI
jgi:hypothetical protein